jgi:hypothetical protein
VAWWKVAGSSEPTNYTFPKITETPAIVIIVAIQDADTTTPLVATSTTGTGTACSTPSVTANSGGELDVRFATAIRGAGSPTWTPPAGYSELREQTGGSGLSGTVAVLSLTAGGATGALNFTASGALDSRIGISIVVPTPSLNADIEATEVDATADIPAPELSAGATVGVVSVDATTTIETPGISAGQTVPPGTVTAQGQVPPPTVAAGSAELVEPATVTAGADIGTPGVSAGATIAADPVDAAADMPTPSITATRQTTITPVTVEARADFGAPDITVPVLPGQFITGDFQIEWAQQLYGGYGNVFQVIAGSVEGWDDLPALDSDSAIRASRHGAWPGKSLAQQREVSAIIAVDDPDTFVTSLRALRRATAVAEDDAEYALVIRTYGEALLAYGAISARVIPAEHYGQGWAQASLRWTCSDPRRYSLTQQSIVVATDGTETLANNGDTATSPRFRILGPAVNPVLLNETRDRILGFDITLGFDQLLEIDTQLGTVMVGDTSRMSTLSGESVPVEDFTFAPGTNVITYETDSGGTAGAEAIWRSAYL